MSDTNKNYSNLSQGDLEAKAKLLDAVLKKHKPEELKEKAFELMQEAEPDSDQFQCYAALYELMDIFKTT